MTTTPATFISVINEIITQYQEESHICCSECEIRWIMGTCNENLPMLSGNPTAGSPPNTTQDTKSSMDMPNNITFAVQPFMDAIIGRVFITAVYGCNYCSQMSWPTFVCSALLKLFLGLGCYDGTASDQSCKVKDIINNNNANNN